MLFKDLAVGDKFDWINPKMLTHNKLFSKCKKASSRIYTDGKGGSHTVRYIEAEVFHVKPALGRKYLNPEDIDLEERIEWLEVADRGIRDAIHFIEKAVEGTGRLEASVKVYLIGWLKNCIGEGNPYDESIPKIIEQIKNL